MSVRIGPGDVEVHYVAEMPATRALEEAKAGPDEAAWAATRLDELASGLALTWEGEALATTPVETPDPARAGEAGFVELHVVRRAALPSPEGTLAVRNGNFPDERCFYATEVKVSGDLVATASSLVRVEDGRLRDDRHGAWVRDERAREPSVTVRPARLFEEQDGYAALPARMEGIVDARPPWWVHVLGVFGLAGLGAAGRWLGRRVRG